MKRKTFPLRINPDVLAAMQRWANDDLRSLNAQIEFILRESLVKAGRYRQASSGAGEQQKTGKAGTKQS